MSKKTHFAIFIEILMLFVICNMLVFGFASKMTEPETQELRTQKTLLVNYGDLDER